MCRFIFYDPKFFFFINFVKCASNCVVTHIELERIPTNIYSPKIYVEAFATRVCPWNLPRPVCLVARKRRSLNHTLRNALALVISESRLCHYLRYGVLSNPAATLTFWYSFPSDSIRLQVCDTCVIGLSSTLLSAPLVIAVKGFSLLLQTYRTSFYTYKRNRIHVDISLCMHLHDDSTVEFLMLCSNKLAIFAMKKIGVLTCCILLCIKLVNVCVYVILCNVCI